MDRQELYLQRIKAFHPNLVVESARLHTRDGQFNDVLVINESVIFRFPRWDEAARELAFECFLLGAIQGRLTLAIPNPVYGDVDAWDPAQRFMGYPMIPGEPLTRETVENLVEDVVLERLAMQLGVFMRELHSLPLADLLPEYTNFDGPDYWEKLYASFRAELFPFMRRDARDHVARHFESYLGEPRHFAYTPVLRHGDFGFGNILYDPAGRRITGVIDWSSAGPGDPAVDLAAISSAPAALKRSLEAVYPVSVTMRERMRFYRGTYALQQALYGLRGHDKAAFADGIAAYI